MSVFPNPPPPSAADVILCERSLTQINQANSNTCPTQYFVQAWYITLHSILQKGLRQLKPTWIDVLSKADSEPPHMT